MSRVLPEYAVEGLLDCRLLAHGLNDSYLVRTSNAQYVLRVYQAPRAMGRAGRTEPEILYEVDLLRHLDRKGVPVSLPVPRRDGRYTTELAAPEGTRRAVLFTYASGEPLTPANQDTARSYLYGQALAEIHNATDDFESDHARFSLDLTFLIDEPLRSIEPVRSHRRDNWHYLLQLADRVREQIARLPAQALDAGPCHGDATGGNAHLAGDNTLTFFDFDVCGRGWRAYDLAVFYWGAALGKSRLGRSDEEVNRLWAACRQGYTERRPLRDVDLAAIPVMVAVRHFWFLGLHTGNWHNWSLHEVDDRFFDRELAFLREWAAEHIDTR